MKSCSMNNVYDLNGISLTKRIIVFQINCSLGIGHPTNRFCICQVFFSRPSSYLLRFPHLLRGNGFVSSACSWRLFCSTIYIYIYLKPARRGLSVPVMLLNSGRDSLSPSACDVMTLMLKQHTQCTWRVIGAHLWAQQFFAYLWRNSWSSHHT